MHVHACPLNMMRARQARRVKCNISLFTRTKRVYIALRKVALRCATRRRTRHGRDPQPAPHAWSCSKSRWIERHCFHPSMARSKCRYTKVDGPLSLQTMGIRRQNAFLVSISAYVTYFIYAKSRLRGLPLCVVCRSCTLRSLLPYSVLSFLSLLLTIAIVRPDQAHRFEDAHIIEGAGAIGRL
jgi:hypothetical protein